MRWIEWETILAYRWVHWNFNKRSLPIPPAWLPLVYYVIFNHKTRIYGGTSTVFVLSSYLTSMLERNKIPMHISYLSYLHIDVFDVDLHTIFRVFRYRPYTQNKCVFILAAMYECDTTFHPEKGQIMLKSFG